MFGKELFSQFTAPVFHQRLSNCMCAFSLLVLSVCVGFDCE